MALASLYTHDVEVQRLTQVDNVYGGEDNSWASSITSYPCRIYTATGFFNVKDIGGFEGKTLKLIGTNADILENDKVIDGDDEYLVMKVYKTYDKDSIHHLECTLNKIK